MEEAPLRIKILFQFYVFIVINHFKSTVEISTVLAGIQIFSRFIDPAATDTSQCIMHDRPPRVPEFRRVRSYASRGILQSACQKTLLDLLDLTSIPGPSGH